MSESEQHFFAPDLELDLVSDDENAALLSRLPRFSAEPCGNTLQRKIAEMRENAAQLRAKNPPPVSAALAPDRHPTSDFFVLDVVDYALKDDIASMEAPIFSLATREDMKLWKWSSLDGKKSVEVAPGFHGRATQHDKDILIYCTSQMMQAINDGREIKKTVRFTAHDFLVATNRGVCKDDYERMRTALERLAGTRIKTEIRTGGQRAARGFGIIDSWQVVEKAPDDSRMVAVEITLSDWLYNSIQHAEVLTIHRDYFRLRKPLERRLYEIARKHVGGQGVWDIGLEALREKCGSNQKLLRRFREDVKAVIERDALPDYRLSISDCGQKVRLYSRNQAQVAKKLLKKLVDKS